MTSNHRKYFEAVGGLDEVFGLFLLKNYKSLPTGSKKSSFMDARLMMQSNQHLPEINKIPLKMTTKLMMEKWKQLVKQMLWML